MSKLKIALMSSPMDNRRGKGTAIYARKLIEHLLQNKDLDITLVHYDSVPDPLYEHAREIIMPRLKLPFATRFVRTLLFFWKYRNEDFDIIHWLQPRLYPFFWLAPAKHTVVTAHGAGDITAPGQFPFSRRAYNAILRYFQARIDAIIAVSEFGKAEIVEWYRAAPHKVHAIYNGGGEDFQQLQKSIAQARVESLGVSGAFILDVSRLEPHKNVDMLLKAYEIVRRTSAFSHKLVILGAHRFGSEETVRRARASPYTADILFIPYVDASDLNSLYSAADLFVFPSLNEGFGLPVIEAFASGTPVITSNSTALPEIAGGAAITVNPLDEVEIAGAIVRVLSDEKLQSELVQKGLRRAGEFTWEKSATKTAELYTHLSDR